MLELKVEETFWGEPEQKQVFVLDTESGVALHRHGDPVVGEDSIWFLERERVLTSFDSPAREKLAKIVGSAHLQVVGLWGLARLPIEKVDKELVVCLERYAWVIPESLPIIGGHSTKKPALDWDQLRESDLENWLRPAIAACVPSIDAVMNCTAPVPQPVVTIDKKGHARRTDSFHGDKELEVGADGLRDVLSIVEREHFFELPVEVGTSLAPDSTSYWLRIRTERGGRQIRIDGPADPLHDSPARLEAHARAMRVWDAIPLVREWKIAGR